jgi:hypothetical protein
MVEAGMTAAEILRDAAQHNVRVWLDGDQMLMNAPMKPPERIICALKENKPGIVAILRAAIRPTGYSDDEWLAAVGDAVRLGYWVHPIEQDRPC